MTSIAKSRHGQKATSMGSNPGVQRMAASLSQADGWRVEGYKKYLDFYNGAQWEDLPAPNEKRLTFNYARIFVHKAASYLMGKGVSYAVQAPQEEGQDEAAAAQHAEGLLQICYEPFVQVVGNSLRYNQELTTGSVDFYGVGDTWTEDAMTVAEKTAQLAILDGDADVDAFLQQTYSDPNDLRALVVAAKAKALAQTFGDTFFNGDATANPLQFDGVKVLSAGARTISDGANGATLTLDEVDQLIDMIKPGMPDVLFMSKRSRRKLSSLRTQCAFLAFLAFLFVLVSVF